MTVTLLHGDCLDLLPTLASQSVDLILSDWPYGTTACAWDSVIPLAPLWAEVKRVLKPRGAVVLTASQPFTTTLISSNRAWFRYALIWDKRKATGHLNAKLMPMKRHEDVLIFSPMTLGNFTYNPQMRPRAVVRIDKQRPRRYLDNGTQIYGAYNASAGVYTHYYPDTIIPVSNASQRGKHHGTQKPLALFEYLMRTYSNPGDLVLDNAFGSCTTGEAAIRLGRAFIGMEKDAGYFAIGAARCAAAQAAPVQAALLEVAP